MAMEEAQSKRDDTIMFIRAQHLGLREVEPMTEEFFTAYKIEDGIDSVVLQYRSYDSSGPFSLGPDINVYNIKLIREFDTLIEKQVKFPD